jgi:hypothetical protein
MKAGTRLRLGRALGVLLALLMASSLAAAAEFSADLVKNDDLVVTKGRIYVKGAKYRLELNAPFGPDVVVLVDPGSNVTRVLTPRYKLYLEMACDDSMSRMNDPFQGVEALAAHYDLKEAGTEEIEGLSCVKQVFRYGEMAVATRWVSKKLGFPIKLVMNQQENTFTSLGNIVEEPVAEDRLLLPDGFAKATLEEIQAKVDADPAMAEKEKLFHENRVRRLELNQTLSPGDEFRVLVREGVKIRAEVKDGFDEPFAWSVVPWRKGKPLEEKAKCSHEGMAKLEIPDDLKADMVVAESTKGRPCVRLRFLGKAPLVLAQKKRLFLGRNAGKSWMPLGGAKKITVTVTAEMVEGSKDAKAVGKFTASGPGKPESTDFELANGESKTFVVTEEDRVSNLGLDMRAGRVKVEIVEDARPADQQTPL